MAFVCPRCSDPGALEVELFIHLPPDSRSDEILLQVVRCSACAFRGLAAYEESRRGALDAEAWEHTGAATPAVRVEAVARAIRRCPRPSDPACGCESHRALAQQDPGGRWQGLAGLGAGAGAAFPLVLSPD